MIFVDKTNILMIPRMSDKILGSSSYKLNVVSKLLNVNKEFTGNASTYGDFWLVDKKDIEELQDGEYEYIFTTDIDITEGMLRVGTIQPNITFYDADVNYVTM